VARQIPHLCGLHAAFPADDFGGDKTPGRHPGAIAEPEPQPVHGLNPEDINPPGVE